MYSWFLLIIDYSQAMKTIQQLNLSLEIFCPQSIYLCTTAIYSNSEGRKKIYIKCCIKGLHYLTKF